MRAAVSAPGIFQHAHSLLNVANVIEGERAENGVAFTPNGCEVIFAHDAGCWVGDEKAIQGCHLAEFDAFVLELTLGWSTLDMDFDPKAHAMEAMKVGSSAVLERLAAMAPVHTAAGTNMAVPAMAGAVSATGITGKARTASVPPFVQPYLTNATTVGAAAEAKAALGQLEAKLIDASDHIGGAGTIWISPAHFATSVGDLLTETNGQYRTKATGSKVIIGNIPLDEMYAVIGDVDVYLGPVEPVDEVERARNEYVVQFEQFAAVVWNTCAAFKHDVT